MILINNNWEQIDDLHNVSKIIREYYNRELADKLDTLIPKHTDAQYKSLIWELREKEDEIFDLENDIDELESEVEYLEKQVEELENKLNETN